MAEEENEIMFDDIPDQLFSVKPLEKENETKKRKRSSNNKSKKKQKKEELEEGNYQYF